MARAKSQSAQRYPLTAILGSDAGVRLCRELLVHGGQLSRTELARRTGLSLSSVMSGVLPLVAAGLVTAAGSGRGVLYGVRADHPLAAALSALFSAEETRFGAVLDSIRIAAAAPDVIALWLFGSVARGHDRPDSDLDLALVAEPDRLTALADGVRDRLVAPSGQLHYRPVVTALGTDDVLRLAAVPDPWWLNVADDAIALIGRRPTELADWLRRRRTA